MDRMRFPEQAFELIRQEDPDTSITVNYIRTLAKTGKIPVVMIGRRHLVNVDALLNYLAHPEQHQYSEITPIGRIRMSRP
ncbi:DNA-binding protein [Oscillospiraceae bacterium WX1]